MAKRIAVLFDDGSINVHIDSHGKSAIRHALDERDMSRKSGDSLPIIVSVEIGHVQELTEAEIEAMIAEAQRG